jgi:trans-aconitate methyltransferase
VNTTQSWNPESYARHARFVSDLAQPVVDLLAPRAGERILDLGCGDGVLTAALAARGCAVLGVDSSAAQVEATRRLGVPAEQHGGEALPHTPAFTAAFDAVFSNAALHWMRPPAAVAAGVWRALVPGGRFVGEFGGQGGVARIRTALEHALDRRGLDGAALCPWYFPSDDEYRAVLTAAGFRLEHLALFARPTLLPGDLADWLQVFAQSYTGALPAAERATFIAEVRDQLRPELCDGDGRWTADYVRLRFRAIKVG